MSDKGRLGKEILGHLKLYRELGIHWMRKPDVREQTIAGGRQKRVPPAPRASVSKPGIPTQKTIADISLLKPMFSKPESLEEIWAELKGCKRCKLAPTRLNIVFGSGNPHADLMFVGEAPGSEEDEQGLPFVGRAGQLLTRIIEAMEMNRDDVYICNIIKCRPPDNRNPEADEIAACESFLFRQIAAVKPKVICALGAFGAQTLLRTTETIGRLRGHLRDYGEAKLMVTYHPAYLLRNPYEKRKVWEDMQIVRGHLRSWIASNNC